MFKAAQWLSFISITGRGYASMCVTRFKITLRAGDRYPDGWLSSSCWIEEQSTHIIPRCSSHSLRPPSRGDGEVGEGLRVIYEPARLRWGRPAIACQEVTLQGERLRPLKCHFLQFTASPLTLPRRPGWKMCVMKNGPHYGRDPRLIFAIGLNILETWPRCNAPTSLLSTLPCVRAHTHTLASRNTRTLPPSSQGCL